ncbi:MAG: methylenetetrahydrofolate reductase C-terminal domain-containing protein, partial [Desulfobulbaceae bacterium]|nr:methylenetetrahydrofolate reductase C-terminal domain-containing protein [Desulfobulbaceae bacterium]
MTTESSFRRSLFDRNQFTLTFELVPSRGGHSKGQSRLLNLARQAAADGRMQAVSITENAGGHPALSPEVLGQEIQAMGLEVINHFSCKDKNRNQMESLLFSWDRQGLHNLLVLSGDYPQEGYQGRPKPVFDLDSVQVLDLISQMNRGRIEASHPEAALEFTPTSFLKGVAVSPFKLLPSELFLQYAKLHRKIKAGADYIITQLGYDARKFHEVLLYLKLNNFNLPVLGNVFIPNLTVAKLMHHGEIPGCVVSDTLYAQIMEEAASPDRGRQARLIRAAKLLAILKGLGYAGAHIGGPGLTFTDLDFVISQAHDLTPDWRDLVPELTYWPDNGAYFYAQDPENGLNMAQAIKDPAVNPGLSIPYALSHAVHSLFFEPDGAGFTLARKLCLGLGEAGYDTLLMKIEYLIKLLLFGCQNCGDCRLADLAYLCP